MPNSEFVNWFKYFNTKPYGIEEDTRTALLMQTTYQGKTKLNIDKFFPTIRLMKENNKIAQKLSDNPFLQLMKERGKDTGVNITFEN